MNPSDFFFDISKLIKSKRWESGARTLNIGIPCSSTANEKSNTSNVAVRVEIVSLSPLSNNASLLPLFPLIFFRINACECYN